MQRAEDLLAAFGIGGDVATQARARLTAGSPGAAALRAEVAAMLARTISPADHPIAVWLLQQEITAASQETSYDPETLYILVAVVARFARASDGLLLWRARQATPETRAGVDVEQLARAGVDPTRQALVAARRAGDVEAAEALQWFEEGAASGAFDDLPGYFAWADERFGLHTSGPT